MGNSQDYAQSKGGQIDFPLALASKIKEEQSLQGWVTFGAKTFASSTWVCKVEPAVLLILGCSALFIDVPGMILDNTLAHSQAFCLKVGLEG